MAERNYTKGQVSRAGRHLADRVAQVRSGEREKLVDPSDPGDLEAREIVEWWHVEHVAPMLAVSTRDHLFLIQFNRRTNLSEVEDLGHDVSYAIEVLRQREHDLADEEVEVVLVGSASLETLRKTHSSYFDAAARLGPVLASATD